MKGLKITALILTAAIGAAVLTSCNNPKKPVSSGINILSTQNQGMGGDERAVIDPNALSNNFLFKFNGVTATVNIDPQTVVKELGEYAYDEKPGCATNGMNQFYTYNGGSFVITATPADEKAKTYAVYTITLNDDSVSTAEGICIGNTVEQVKAAYGTNPVLDNGVALSYEKGTSSLSFLFDENGKVTSIIYQTKAEIA